MFHANLPLITIAKRMQNTNSFYIRCWFSSYFFFQLQESLSAFWTQHGCSERINSNHKYTKKKELWFNHRWKTKCTFGKVEFHKIQRNLFHCVLKPTTKIWNTKSKIEFKYIPWIGIKREMWNRKTDFVVNLYALTGNKRSTAASTRRNSKLVEYLKKKENYVERNRTMSVVHKINGSH